MRNILFNRHSSKLGLLGSLVAVVAVSLVLSLLPKATAQLHAENCVNPPTTPTLNYWPVTYDDQNTPLCHDFPAIDAAVYNQGTAPTFSQSETDWSNGLQLTTGQRGVALMYIHNGAANNLPASQVQAKNVKVTTTTDTSVGTTHTISVKYQGDNTNTVNKSFTVHTPANSKLEIESNSGAIYDYEGKLTSATGLNLGNSTYTIGDMNACFEYSLFLSFRFKVVTETPTENPNLSITKHVRSLNSGSFAKSVTTDKNANVEYRVVVKNTSNTKASNVTMTDTGVSGVTINANSVTVGTTEDAVLTSDKWSGSLPGTLNLGDLAAGEQRVIKYTAKTTSTTGSFVNTAVAKTGNITVQDTATVVVKQDDEPVNRVVTISKVVRNLSTNSSYAENVDTKLGERVGYKITVTNTGNTAINNAKITDTMPAGLQFDDSVAGDGTASFNNNTLTVNFGTLAQGQSRTVEFAAKALNGNNNDTICNIARVSGDDVASKEDNACVKIIIPSKPSNPNITIAKVVKTSSGSYTESVNVNPNERVTFKVTVTNNGDQIVHNVKVTDPIPAGLQFDDSVNTNGASSFNSNTLTVNFGSLNIGESKTVEFAAKATNTSSRICNVARASADNVNSVEDNACVNIDIPNQPGTPNIVISKSAFNNNKNVDATTVTADRGNTITFTLTTKNTGNATKNDYVVTDDLSGVLALADIVDLNGGKLNGNILTFPAIDIKAGETVTKTFKVSVKTTLAPSISYQIKNTYGNTVIINVPGKTVYEAPKTGAAGTSAVVFAGLLTAGAVLVRRGKDIFGFIFA